MRAARLFEYNQPPRVVDVPEPVIDGPFDVIVRIAGAGVCRTDLHIMEAVWREALGDPKLPYTIGHENAGWIEAVGPAASHLEKGDPVILHPLRSCGFCRACRAGNDMHCVSASFPGLDGTDGGYAEYLKTSARAVVKLAPGTESGLGEGWKGGFFCPCHGSKFDLAGRVFKGVPAPSNLEVPPHTYLSDTRLLIGQDSKGA